MTYPPNPQYPQTSQAYSMPPVPAQRERKKFNSVTALFTFYLPSLWRDVGRRWWGIGFLYMLMLLLITWAALFIHASQALNDFIAGEAPKVTRQIPKITINKGQASVDVPEPYTISDSQTGKPLAIIDTTGQTTAPPANYPSLLLTKTELQVRKNAGEVQINSLAGFPNMSFDGTTVQGGLRKTAQFFWPVGYPVIVILNLIFYLVLMLIFAAIGLAFASGTGARLGYGALLRLSAISMTLPILLGTLFTFTSFSPGCWWSIAEGAITLLMLYLAVKANAPLTPPPGTYMQQQGFQVNPAQPWPPQPPGYPQH